jgi:hypothetical protein
MAETTLAEHEHGHEHDHGQIDPQLRDGPSSQPASDVQAAIESLNELNATNQAVLEDLNLTGLLERLQQSIKLLIDSNRRQAEIVSSLLVTGRLPVGGQSNESLGALAGALGLGASTIGSALENVNAVLGMAGAAAAATGQNFTQSSGPAGEWVSKTNLDALRQKVRDGSEMNEIGNEEHGQNGDDDKPKKRRKRTMKLEVGGVCACLSGTDRDRSTSCTRLLIVVWVSSTLFKASRPSAPKTCLTRLETT